MSEFPLAIGIDFGGTSGKTGVVRGGEIIDLAPPIATQNFNGADEIIGAIIRTVGDLGTRSGSACRASWILRGGRVRTHQRPHLGERPAAR